MQSTQLLKVIGALGFLLFSLGLVDRLDSGELAGKPLIKLSGQRGINQDAQAMQCQGVEYTGDQRRAGELDFGAMIPCAASVQ